MQNYILNINEIIKCNNCCYFFEKNYCLNNNVGITLKNGYTLFFISSTDNGLNVKFEKNNNIIFRTIFYSYPLEISFNENNVYYSLSIILIPMTDE